MSDTVYIKGPKGDKGDRGPQGPQGYTGEQGPRGERGYTGEQGPPGEMGPQGYTGEQGPMGYTGEQGERGERGEQGPPGPRGPQGEKGDRGEKGEQGEPGTANMDIVEMEIDHEIREHKKEYDHSLIHDPKMIGYKEVDLSNLEDGKILAYSQAKDKFVFIRLAAPKISEGSRSLMPATGGSTKKNIRLITADSTVVKRDQYIHIDASSNDVNLTFYSAVGNDGRNYYIKRVDNSANTVTLVLTGSETIEFEVTDQLPNRGSGREVYAYGGNWFIKSSS